MWGAKNWRSRHVEQPIWRETGSVEQQLQSRVLRGELRHRHAYWAFGVLIIVVEGLWLATAGPPGMEQGAVAAAATAAAGLALVAGGIGYSRGWEWGRRSTDIVLWCVVAAVSVFVGRARHEASNAVIGIGFVALTAWWRLELWRPEALGAFDRDRLASPRLRLVLLLRMAGVAVLAVLLGPYAVRR